MSDSIKIRRALISVHDKTGIVEFARALHEEFGIELISTGGTAKALKDAGLPVTLVEEITGFPEMLDGRVKTLHPKIHAAILADRDNAEHMRQLNELGIEPIDMVVVNLYPFEQTIARPGCTFEEAIEMIDIGGPCLLRAAAKNHRGVWVLSDPWMYNFALIALRNTPDSEGLRAANALSAFRKTCAYDTAIVKWLGRDPDGFVNCVSLHLQSERRFKMRYGENPHQAAQVFQHGLATPAGRDPIGNAYDCDVPMSFNNYMDANAALELCAELTRERASKEPRASARAVPRTEPARALDGSTAFLEPDPDSAAWLLTWTTYGSWLPGDTRGFVSRRPGEDAAHVIRNIPGTLYDADQKDVEDAARERMQGTPVTLERAHALTALGAFVEAARNHNIRFLALSIMPDHVHLLCQGAQSGSELMQLFKGVSARHLGQAHQLAGAPRWWTKASSKRYIRKGEDLQPAVAYVRQQKSALWAGSFADAALVNAAGALTAARAEARGSLPACESHAVCFIKHTNACGVAVDADPVEAYRRAYLGDPNAAMGGVLAVNFAVTPDFAEAVMETYQRWGKAAGAGGFFVEVWLTPSFEEAAVNVIRTKKEWGQRVRLLAVGDLSTPPDVNEMDFKRIAGGVLMQTRDLVGLNEEQWQVVTKRAPSDAEMNDLRLAWLVCKHTKSNAITICRDGMLIGNGAGQMSRVMSCRIATWLAQENGHADQLRGAVAASDAFFPFRDGPDILMDAGVTALIQPGGSKRDEDTVQACDERGIAMIFTGTRHFRH